jgi:hypothetical protein
VCAKLCGLGEDVADLRFEMGVKRGAAETDLVLVVSRMLNHCTVLKSQEPCLGVRSSERTEEKLGEKIGEKRPARGLGH